MEWRQSHTPTSVCDWKIRNRNINTEHDFTYKNWRFSNTANNVRSMLSIRFESKNLYKRLQSSSHIHLNKRIYTLFEYTHISIIAGNGGNLSNCKCKSLWDKLRNCNRCMSCNALSGRLAKWFEPRVSHSIEWSPLKALTDMDEI